jgi:hypothetical protein
MSPVEARIRFYARCFAEYEMRLQCEEIRTRTLTERMAMVEDDIENIQNMFAKINCAPTVTSNAKLSAANITWTATPYQLTGSD